MGFASEYNALRKKRLGEEEEKIDNNGLGANGRKSTTDTKYRTFSEEYGSLRLQRGLDSGIAPTVSTASKSATVNDEQEKATWFDAGAFEDGYDFGDVTKTILGTTQDVVENITEAVFDATENLIDTGAYVVGLFGDDDFKKDVKGFIGQDLLHKEEVSKWVSDNLSPIGWLNQWANDGNTEAASVLGEKSDGLVQSGAHLVGALALNAAAPGVGTLAMGVNAFGSEIEQAAQFEEATYAEMGISGAVSAIAEIAFEKLSSGIKIGGKYLDEGAQTTIARGISNKVARWIIQTFGNMAGEGVEEVATEHASAVGRQLTYMSGKEFEEIISSEDSFDAFLGGVIMSGAGSAVKTGNASVKGVDSVTGLSASEEAVVRQIYNDAVADAKAKGEKVNKNQVWEDANEQLKRGDISIDTIEKVLGGDAYKAYNDTVQNEDAILKEFEELGKKTTPTLADQARYAELSEQVKGIKENSNRSTLKTQLSNSVLEQLKGDRKGNGSALLESYNQTAQRGVAFTADLNKYDAKQKEIVQKAIDAGFLNNTRKTHEFVDFVAKISADKGKTFDFTTNEKLKESGFAIDGKQVNGFVTKDGVTINMNSAKALNSVVGHEVTHILEGTDLYTDLQNAITEYAKTKGDYQGRLDALTELYKGVKDADINKELTADLVGDYLFTDKDFIANLSTKHRNVFQKLFDEIKYLYNVSTAGSAENRKLEKVKKLFVDAYKADTKSSTESKAQYSLAVKEVNGTVHIANPMATTKSEILDYMDKSRRRKLEDNTYFPVSAHTPPSLIATLRNKNIMIADKPLAMQAKKARQSQLDGKPYDKDGATIRFHAMSASEVLETIEKLNDATTIIQEANRKKPIKDDYGNITYVDAPDRFVMAVELDSGDEAVAVIEFDSSIDKGYVVHDGKGEEYHTTVTVFVPDVIKDGMPYDYISHLLDNDSNRELPIIKENSETETAYGENLATASKTEFPYGDIVPQKEGNVNTQFSLSSENGATKDFNLDDFTIDELLAFTDEDFQKAYDALGLEEAFENDGFDFSDKDISIESISEELDVEPEKVEILVRRKGLGDTHVEENRTAVMKQARIDEAIEDSGAKFNPTYARRLITRISPKDFVDLTVTQEHVDRERFDTEVLGDHGNTMGDYDYNKALQESRTPYLEINTSTGQIIGHNGRHRMRALEKAGIESVEIEVELYDADGYLIKNNADTIPDMAISSQFDTAIETHLSNVIPLNETHRAEIERNYGENAHDNAGVKFSLSKPVEETKDLMALHNLKSNELLKSLDLGGLPMPSIAVVKAEAGHDQYGEISLIIPKESIDPQASRDNKVYGGDAWTPTYPRMEYKANDAVAKKISDKYYAMSDEYGSNKVRPLYDYVYEAENALNRSGGESALKEELYDDTRMMQVYLLDSGKGEVPTVQKEIRTELTDNEVNMYEFLAQRLGDEVVNGVNQTGLGSPVEQRKAYWKNHGEAIKEAYGEFLSKEFGFTEEDINNVFSNMKTADFLKIVRDAKTYQTNGRVTIKTEADYNATQEAIREAAGEGYKAWVDDLFGGIEEKSGIRNNRDYFTPSGDRRSWDALHWENTLENVVKAMKQQDRTGSEAVFGVHKFFATASKDYGSIAEIKADADRLHKIDDGDYQAAKDTFEQRFSDIAVRIMDKTERNQFIAMDNAMECIVDAVRESKTQAGIYKELSQYKHLNVTEQDVAEIASLVNDIGNMPTGYFEAKPMRAVGFDEVGVFVIPRNADTKLKQELLNRGYAIAEYDPDVEGDRQKVVNSFEEYKFSLSAEGEAQKSYGNYNVSGEDVLLEQDVAPVQDTTQDSVEEVAPVADDEDFAPFAEHPDDFAMVGDMQAEIDRLGGELASIAKNGEAALKANDTDLVNQYAKQYADTANRSFDLREQLKAIENERIASLDDADAPVEADAPYIAHREPITIDSDALDGLTQEVNKILFLDAEDSARMAQTIQNYAQSDSMTESDLYEEILNDYEYSEKVQVGEVSETRMIKDAKKFMRGTKLYVHKNLKNDFNGERSDGYNAFRKEHFGHFNLTTDPRANAMGIDSLYKELGEMYPGLFPSDIINEADQLKQMGYVATMTGSDTKLLTGQYDERTVREVVDTIARGVAQYSQDETLRGISAEREMMSFEDDDIAPVSEAIKPKTEKITGDEAKPPKNKTAKTDGEEKIAKIITHEDAPDAPKKKSRLLSKTRSLVFDKQSAIEDLSLKTKNRELMAKADALHRSESRAQRFIGKGADGVKALNDVMTEVKNSGQSKNFQNYMYHALNVDRMSLESKELPNRQRLEKEMKNLKLDKLNENQLKAIAYEYITKDTTEKRAHLIKTVREYLASMEVKNKPVYGDSVTAEASQKAVAEYEAKHPEFKAWAKDIYSINEHLRDMLVEQSVISQETADLFAKMYPHYVPIRREGYSEVGVNVPLDTNKTGVNSPIKRATGGNSNILDMFDTMAKRIEQTFKAVDRNSLGIELKNALGVATTKESSNIDDIFNNFDNHEELLQKGKDGVNPTFTVFEDGKRVTFDITEDLYDALKPTNETLAMDIKPLSVATNIQRGLLTQYNPMFTATNAIKDAQSVLVNSQHATTTYLNIPAAVKDLAVHAITGKESQYLREYFEHGGEDLTYFDNRKNTFTKDTVAKKIFGFVPSKISAANDFIERIPRLAEYIASRKAGRSVEVSMLDAARVTTNFAAGGDLAKFINRNGFTFFNASVQGFNQQVRNIREAKANGFKGVMQLAAKYAIAGLPVMLFNHLMWDDDEEYEELSDYIKDNYYIVAKYGDGEFVRIPKGREVAVIQNAFEQMKNLITGDDEVDFARFGELLVENIAPNNPFDNNVIAPVWQAATNKTWYGDDLVPTRLQDVPDAEQYDETTDAISKWLGEKLDYSPYKINYLLDQYSGGIGDVFLPMMTQQSDGGGAIAPWADKFTTDSVMKNQNVSDFYDKADELTVNANSMYATDEDTLMSKYMNSVSAELGELYQQKREIQNSDKSDAYKDAASREIQSQINAIAKNGIATYGNVSIDGVYATVGDIHYRWYEPDEDSSAEPGWQKISDKQLKKQEEVTRGLGISASDYWSNKEEYDYAYDNPSKYAIALSVGGYEAYKGYQSELYDIKPDKDASGKSISGSRKEKVIDYVNGLDIDYGERLILFKSEYPSDDDYNYDIIDYLNGRDDISYDEMVTILKELGFTVDSRGNIYWD